MAVGVDGLSGGTESEGTSDLKRNKCDRIISGSSDRVNGLE